MLNQCWLCYFVPNFEIHSSKFQRRRRFSVSASLAAACAVIFDTLLQLSLPKFIYRLLQQLS